MTKGIGESGGQGTRDQIPATCYLIPCFPATCYLLPAACYLIPLSKAYSILSARARQLASIMLVLAPTVLQRRVPGFPAAER
jgi:hypothetical protein